MKDWLTRWDLKPGEQAGMTFAQVLTVVNLRRVEIACLLGLSTRIAEYAGGFRSSMILGQIGLAGGLLFLSLVMRRSGSAWLARAFVAIFLVTALLSAQWAVAVIGAQGRLTSAYPVMLLSLALLFVIPPRIVMLGLTELFVTYCVFVSRTTAVRTEKIIAIENAAIISVIAVIAAALIHAGRRRDYDQERAMRRQNEELAERNAELDMVMAITAHDVRSPLYGLRNLFDLTIRRAPQQPELPLIALREGMASIDAMLALATRLLDAHAAEHRPVSKLIEEDVRGHIRSAADRIGPLAQSAEVYIVLDLPDAPLIAPLDPGALAQILDNLLSNAVRFSPRGGAVTIASVDEGWRVTIAVRDQGLGIDPARRAMLFRKFHREDGDADGVRSTGMGLFIVATLAERIGADVRYEANAGLGASFVVRLAQPGR